MIDKNEVRQRLHDIAAGLSILGMVVCPLYFLLLAVVGLKTNLKKLYFNLAAIITELIMFYNALNDVSFLNSRFGFWGTWLICPTRLQVIVMILGAVVVVNFYKFLKSNADDWMREDERKEREQAIPDGEFDFEDKNHVLAVATTGAGKTSLAKLISENHISKGTPMIIISGKSANGDKESLLAKVRELCEKFGKKLMVVSLNPDEESEPYNPLRRLSPETVKEILTMVSPFSEKHYEVNFSSWILKVAQLIRYMGIEMSLSNLMTLYDYDKFEEYLEKAHRDGRVSDEQKERLIDGAEDNYKIAKDSKERFKQYLMTDNLRRVLTGKGMQCFDDILKENGVLFLDLHGPSYPGLTKDLATFALADVAYALDRDKDSDQRKVILLDELSFYCSPMLTSLYATARSTGGQIISFTQSFNDIDMADPVLGSKLTEKLIENSNAYCFMRLNSSDDAERAANLCATRDKIKRTQKHDGIRYDSAGTSQVTKEYNVHPDDIKNMPKLTYYYCNKDTGVLCRGKIKFDNPKKSKSWFDLMKEVVESLMSSPSDEIDWDNYDSGIF